MTVQKAYDDLRNALVDAFRIDDQLDALDYALNILGQEAGANVKPIAASPLNGRIKI